MPEIPGATMTFTDYSAPGTPRLLNIPDGHGDVTVEDVWDTLATFAGKVENLHYKSLIIHRKSTGLQTLSTVKQNGRTLTMGNVRVKFPDQPGPGYVIKRVVDGNLVAVDHNGADMEAIESSDFTNFKNEADTSAAVVSVGTGLTAAQDAILTRLLDLLEADEEVRAASYRRLHRITKVELMAKDKSGVLPNIDLVEPP